MKSDFGEIDDIEGLDQNEINEEDEEFPEGIDDKLLEELKAAKEKKMLEKKEKLQKREEDYTKKLKEKNKVKDEAAYTSLADYQQKRQKPDGTMIAGFNTSDSK